MTFRYLLSDYGTNWCRVRISGRHLFQHPPPPDIHNSTSQPSAPGEPIEDCIFNASNQAEDISFFSNKGLEVEDDMEPAPDNITLVDNPADDTLFEG